MSRLQSADMSVIQSVNRSVQEVILTTCLLCLQVHLSRLQFVLLSFLLNLCCLCEHQIDGSVCLCSHWQTQANDWWLMMTSAEDRWQTVLVQHFHTQGDQEGTRSEDLHHDPSLALLAASYCQSLSEGEKIFIYWAGFSRHIEQSRVESVWNKTTRQTKVNKLFCVTFHWFKDKFRFAWNLWNQTIFPLIKVI